MVRECSGEARRHPWIGPATLLAEDPVAKASDELFHLSAPHLRGSSFERRLALEQLVRFSEPLAGSVAIAPHHVVGHRDQTGHAHESIRLLRREPARLAPPGQSGGGQTHHAGDSEAPDSGGGRHLIQRRERQTALNQGYRSLADEKGGREPVRFPASCTSF